MLSRALAYVACGIPAAIGIGFVSRFAYVTSDTAIDGAATAFLYAMVAAGAFLGPAIVIAVAANGRKWAAALLGLLTFLAIMANWSHTLGAIAHRGSGTEAESAKAKSGIADLRAELNSVLEKQKVLPPFTPTDADAVSAARRAADTATKIQQAECNKRGPNCRQRELDEQAAVDKLAITTTAKAATDRATTLDSQAAGLRAQLAKAPAVKDSNPLGSALARLLPWVPAASAATYQQAGISLIAELLIAAGLALPELLRPDAVARVAGEPPMRENAPQVPQAPPTEAPTSDEIPKHAQPSIAGVPLNVAPRPERVGGVPEFMMACLPRERGQDVALPSIYRRYVRWCDEQAPAVAPEEAGAFAEQFKVLSGRVRLRTEKRGGKVYVRDVRLVA